MNFSIKEIAFVLLLVILSISTTRYCTPAKLVYSTGAMSQKLDSITTLSRSLVLTKSQLQDSLKQTSKSFQNYIDKTRDDIASYARVNGKLRLWVDSLTIEVNSASLDDLVNNDTTSSNKFRDTTLVSTSVWSDSLFQLTSKGGIKNDSLFLDPPAAKQLRMIRIDIATIVADDWSNVSTIVSSKDFDGLKVDSYTELKQKRRFPWTEIIAVASFILGYAL